MLIESKILLAALTGCSLVGGLIAVVLAIRVRALNQRLQVALRPAAPEPFRAPEGQEGGAPRFVPALMKAGLKAHLDQDRAQRPIPEKYRFIGLLAEHGVSGEQISAVLNLAEQEVSQAIALARLARRPQPDSASGRQPRRNPAKETRAASRHENHAPQPTALKDSP